MVSYSGIGIRKQLEDAKNLKCKCEEIKKVVRKTEKFVGIFFAFLSLICVFIKSDYYGVFANFPVAFIYVVMLFSNRKILDDESKKGKRIRLILVLLVILILILQLFNHYCV